MHVGRTERRRHTSTFICTVTVTATGRCERIGRRSSSSSRTNNVITITITCASDSVNSKEKSRGEASTHPSLRWMYTVIVPMLIVYLRHSSRAKVLLGSGCDTVMTKAPGCNASHMRQNFRISASS